MVKLMNDHWKKVKIAILLFALPLAATAAASAHHWMTEAAPISVSESSLRVNEDVANRRVHTVAVNRDGIIYGRIVSFFGEGTKGLSDLSLYFIRKGQIVGRASTDANGMFSVSGLAEGAYSFIATGNSGFAAYGMRVVSDSAGKYDNVMECGAVRNELIRQIIFENIPYEVDNDPDYHVEPMKQSIGSNRVRRQAGDLVGKVLPMYGEIKPVAGNVVYIYKNKVEISQRPVNEDGSFLVEDMGVGVYELVVSGPNGFAAVSFEVVDEDKLSMGNTDSDELPVSGAQIQDDASLDVFEIILTRPGDGQIIRDEILPRERELDIVEDSFLPIEPLNAPVDGIVGFPSAGVPVGGVPITGGVPIAPTTGFAPAPIGPTGFTGAGGGGLARLGLLGATLGVGIAALADDDNNPPDGTPTN